MREVTAGEIAEVEMTLSDEFRELNQRFLKAIEERGIEGKEFFKAARELINTVEMLAEEIDGALDDYLDD